MKYVTILFVAVFFIFIYHMKPIAGEILWNSHGLVFKIVQLA